MLPTHRHSYPNTRSGESAWPSSRRHGANPGRLSRIVAKRSTQAVGIAILIILLLLFASHSHRQPQPVGPSVELSQKPSREGGAGGKYAIITFETRDVTYWRESLGNKFEYARKHGYPKYYFFKAECKVMI